MLYVAGFIHCLVDMNVSAVHRNELPKIMRS